MYHDDRPIEGLDTLGEVIGAISYWEHYDNWTSGHYINENDAGYGPILIFNCSVRMWKDDREIDRWGRGPSAKFPERVFHGDLSDRRLARFITIARKFDVKVCVYHEHEPDYPVLTVVKEVGAGFITKEFASVIINLRDKFPITMELLKVPLIAARLEGWEVGN
jgi:hypothetical protein